MTMNYGVKAPCDALSSKENVPPASKADASQVQRTRQRTVLGALSDNEQRGRSVSRSSQVSKHSSVSGSSQHALAGCTSSSGFDVYVEEACEVVLGASGQDVAPHADGQDKETDELQSDDLRILLGLSSSLSQDSSQLSEQDDPLMSLETLRVSDYAKDIHKHLRESEVKFRPLPGYLEKHPEITSSMRVILVDWLAEVVHEYGLRSETLHLAVDYVDRFLSCTSQLRRSRLQLVGAAALLVASKYEEIYPPALKDFVYITDDTYTVKQLIRFEHILLKVLAFRMAAPTSNQFLRLYMSVHSVCANTESLALYIAELSLLEMEPFLHYMPSMVAAAAFCLASYTINKSLWPEFLSTFTGYTMAVIEPCLLDLHQLYVNAESYPHQNIRKKYKSSKYCCVSWMSPPDALPSF